MKIVVYVIIIDVVYNLLNVFIYRENRTIIIELDGNTNK